MNTLSPNIEFFLNLAKIQTVMNRRFDAGLNGIGFHEFVILFHLSQAAGQKLRRIDLADKVGLTASGITRILLPMEKIGLIQKEVDERDARVSYVLLAPGGKEKLTEGLERAEYISAEALRLIPEKKISDLSKALVEIGRTVR